MMTIFRKFFCAQPVGFELAEWLRFGGELPSVRFSEMGRVRSFYWFCSANRIWGLTRLEDV